MFFDAVNERLHVSLQVHDRNFPFLSAATCGAAFRVSLAVGLKRLQIFEQFLFVLVRQLRAVCVTLVAVSFLSRIEQEVRLC